MSSRQALLDDKQEKTFRLPVDSECKAIVFRPWLVRGVHMKAFHASWLSLFVSFFSTFAPAALSVSIRDDLNLTDEDISNANIAAIAGTVAARLLIGSLCDVIGPRLAHFGLMLITAVGVFVLCIVENALGYILCRLIIGLSLGSFVASQYWCSVVFNVRIVGRANAVAAGIGTSGGGVVQVVMPLVYSIMNQFLEPFVAWRAAMMLPGIMQLLVAIFILTSTQDLPDGSFKELLKRGEMKRVSALRSWRVASAKYMVWLCAFSDAISLGVELVMDNIAAAYFYDNFAVNFTMAGLLGSLFGILNIVARPTSGYLSDVVAMPFGMRGRLGYLLFCHLFGAAFLIMLAFSRHNLLLACFGMMLTAMGTEGAQAALFAVVPFVSKRSLGIVNGIVGAGGNFGGVMISFIFFDKNRFEIDQSFLWTGVALTVASFHVLLYYFPMWGGILCGPRSGVEESDYYLAEYTREEILEGKADRSLRFASEARSQRSSRQRGGSQSGPGHKREVSPYRARFAKP